MKFKFFMSALSLSLIFLAGCFSVGHKIDQTRAARIQKGVTTRQQVINLIGSPDQITTLPNGDTIYMYNYHRITAKPATFIPLLGAFVGGANVQNQMYMVYFGPDGLVKTITSSYGATESSEGLATATKASMPDVENHKRPK